MQNKNNGSLRTPFKPPAAVRTPVNSPARVGVLTTIPLDSDMRNGGDNSMELFGSEGTSTTEEYSDDDIDQTEFDQQFEDRITEVIDERIDEALKDVMQEVIFELRALVQKLAPIIVKEELKVWTNQGKYLVDQCAVCGDEHGEKPCSFKSNTFGTDTGFSPWSA